MGRDGCIYALAKDGRVLEMDTTDNSHRIVGNRVDSDHYYYGSGWGDAILGIDGCVLCLLATILCHMYSEV